MNPEHAASKSNAAARLAPSLCCTRQAVEGNGMSGVMVATMIKSICSAVTPAMAMARRAASAPRSDVYSLSAAMWRSLMPVRVVIHSSVVSTIFSRSALVRIFVGTYAPTPLMEQVRPLKSNLARGFLNFLVCGLMQSMKLSFRGCQSFICSRDLFGDQSIHAMADFFSGHANGVGNGALAGGAVGFDDGAIQAKNDRAAIHFGIHALFHFHQPAFGEHSA